MIKNQKVHRLTKPSLVKSSSYTFAERHGNINTPSRRGELNKRTSERERKRYGRESAANFDKRHFFTPEEVFRAY